jgi:hypothetical protein
MRTKLKNATEKPRHCKTRYIYNTNCKLLHKGMVKDCAKWLVENEYIGTINAGNDIIKKRVRSKKIYKGLYITDNIISA